jgi:hypothetical protein
MTAITFPTDPDNGELYTAPNGAVYIWDGEKWMVNSTIYTGPELENITQDRVAPMFVNGNHTGITFAYDAETNTLTSTVTGGGGISITDFGEGFSLTDTNKIVTNKLYSTNPTQPNQHYRLELDTNGVIRLPDGSIINGSTIRGISGTSELNYTGITIGPNSNDAEKTWMWVDHANAYISTNNFANTWTFGNNGTLTSPNGATQTSTGSINCQPEVDTVVFTSSQEGIQTIKLVLQIEVPKSRLPLQFII